MKNKKTEFPSIALLLQGGGALGAYQAGVYQALCEAGLEPNWVAGISIGAINAAIIAGNAPADRLPKLREFWESITFDNFRYTPPVFQYLLTRNNMEHQTLNTISALRAIFMGIPGFFHPRMIPAWFAQKSSIDATSFYDDKCLKATLERLIDFDMLNHNGIRYSSAATHVTSGNFVVFDNSHQPIGVEHVMASAALPPGLPAVKIGDDYYWDGGIVSNTPLQWLLESRLEQNTLIFQIDLWSADGEFPQNMAEVFTRQKDIQYSSRTRANTDRFRERQRARHTLGELLEKLPPEYRNLPEAKLLEQRVDKNVYNIVHVIYHNKDYEGYSKDFEFSRLSMEAHWQSGYEDTQKTLSHPEVLQLPRNKEGIAIYDFSRETFQRQQYDDSAEADSAKEKASKKAS